MCDCGRQLTNRSSRRPPQPYHRAPPLGNPGTDGGARGLWSAAAAELQTLAGRRAWCRVDARESERRRHFDEVARKQATPTGAGEVETRLQR